MTVRLRDAVPGDGAALSALYAAAVRGQGAQSYNPAQIEAWAGLTPTGENLEARLADGRIRLVAMDADGRPLGFVDLESDGHIDLLYVAPDAGGRGLGRALLEAAERQARDAGLVRLYAEASERARATFEAAGFGVTARRDFEVAGVPIHNWAVEKAL